MSSDNSIDKASNTENGEISFTSSAVLFITLLESFVKWEYDSRPWDDGSSCEIRNEPEGAEENVKNGVKLKSGELIGVIEGANLLVNIFNEETPKLPLFNLFFISLP